MPIDFGHPIVEADLSALDQAVEKAHRARAAGDFDGFRAALADVGAAVNFLCAPHYEIVARADAAALEAETGAVDEPADERAPFWRRRS